MYFKTRITTLTFKTNWSGFILAKVPFHIFNTLYLVARGQYFQSNLLLMSKNISGCISIAKESHRHKNFYKLIFCILNFFCFAAWRAGGQAWIGAFRTDGKFRWTGKSTGLVEVALWGTDQPGTTDNCVVTDWEDEDTLYDYPCTESFHFICEKTSMGIVYWWTMS